MLYTAEVIRTYIGQQNIGQLVEIDEAGHNALSWLLHQDDEEELLKSLLVLLEETNNTNPFTLAPEIEARLSMAFYELTLLAEDESATVCCPKLLKHYTNAWREQEAAISERLKNVSPVSDLSEYAKDVLAVLQKYPFALHMYLYDQSALGVLFYHVATNEDVLAALLQYMRVYCFPSWIGCFKERDNEGYRLLPYLLKRFHPEATKACLDLAENLLKAYDPEENDLDICEEVADLLCDTASDSEVPVVRKFLSREVLPDTDVTGFFAQLQQSAPLVRYMVLKRALVPAINELKTNSSYHADKSLIYRVLMALMKGQPAARQTDLLLMLVSDGLFFSHLCEFPVDMSDGKLEGIFSGLSCSHQVKLLNKVAETLLQHQLIEIANRFLSQMKQAALLFILKKSMELGDNPSYRKTKLLLKTTQQFLPKDDFLDLECVFQVYKVLSRSAVKSASSSPVKEMRTEGGETTQAVKSRVYLGLTQRIDHVLDSKNDIEVAINLARFYRYVESEKANKSNWQKATQGVTSRIKRAVDIFTKRFDYTLRSERKDLSDMQAALTLVLYANVDPLSFPQYIKQQSGSRLVEQSIHQKDERAILLLVRCCLALSQTPDEFLLDKKRQSKPRTFPEWKPYQMLISTDSNVHDHPLIELLKHYMTLRSQLQDQEVLEALIANMKRLLASSDLLDQESPRTKKFVSFLYKFTAEVGMSSLTKNSKEAIAAIQKLFPLDDRILISTLETKDFTEQFFHPVAKVVANPSAKSLANRKVNARNLMIFLNSKPHQVMAVVSNREASIALFDAVKYYPQDFLTFMREIPKSQIELFFTLACPFSDNDLLSEMLMSRSQGVFKDAIHGLLNEVGSPQKVAILSHQSGPEGDQLNPIEKMVVANVSELKFWVGVIQEWLKAGSAIMSVSGVMEILGRKIDKGSVYHDLEEEALLPILSWSIETKDASLWNRLQVVIDNKYPNYSCHFHAAKALWWLHKEDKDSSTYACLDKLAVNLRMLLELPYSDRWVLKMPYLELVKQLRGLDVSQADAACQSLLNQLKKMMTVDSIGGILVQYSNQRSEAEIHEEVVDLITCHREIWTDALLIDQAGNYLAFLAGHDPMVLGDALRALKDQWFEVLSHIIRSGRKKQTVLGGVLAANAKAVCVVQSFLKGKDERGIANLYYQTSRWVPMPKDQDDMESRYILAMQELASLLPVSVIQIILYYVVQLKSQSLLSERVCWACLAKAVDVNHNKELSMEGAYKVAGIYLDLLEIKNSAQVQGFSSDNMVNTEEYRITQSEHDLSHVLLDAVEGTFSNPIEQDEINQRGRPTNRMQAVLAVINFKRCKWEVWMKAGIRPSLKDAVSYLQKNNEVDGPDFMLLVEDQIQHANPNLALYNQELVLMIAEKTPDLLQLVVDSAVLSVVLGHIMKHRTADFEMIIGPLNEKTDFFTRTEGVCGTVLHRTLGNVDSLKLIIDNLDPVQIRAMMTVQGVSGDYQVEKPAGPLLLAVVSNRLLEVIHLLRSVLVSQEMDVAKQVSILGEKFNGGQCLIEQTIIYDGLTKAFAVSLMKHAFESSDLGFFIHLKPFVDKLRGNVSHYYLVINSILYVKEINSFLTQSIHRDSSFSRKYNESAQDFSDRFGRKVGVLNLALMAIKECFESDGPVVPKQEISALLIAIAQEPVVRENAEWLKELNSLSFYFIQSEHVMPSFMQRFQDLSAHLSKDDSSEDGSGEDSASTDSGVVDSFDGNSETELTVAEKDAALLVCEEVLRLLQDLCDCYGEEQPDMAQYVDLSLRLTIIASDVSVSSPVKVLLSALIDRLPVFTPDKVREEVRSLSQVKGLNARNRYYYFCVLRFLMLHYPDQVKFLFSSRVGLTAVLYAVSKRPEEFEKMMPDLVELYPAVLRAAQEDGWMLLHEVVTRHKGKLVGLTIQQYQDFLYLSLVKSAGPFQLTPLAYALQSGHSNAVIVILDAITGFSLRKQLAVLSQRYQGKNIVLSHPEVVRFLGDEGLVQLMIDVSAQGTIADLENFIPIFELEGQDPQGYLARVYALAKMIIMLKTADDSVDLFQGNKDKMLIFFEAGLTCVVKRSEDKIPLQWLVAIVRRLPAVQGVFKEGLAAVTSIFNQVEIPAHMINCTLATAPVKMI